MGKEFTQRGDVVIYQYVKAAPKVDGAPFYIWDIDKTYLNTKFESLRGLIKTAFEKAFQKTNVPGSVSLIKALENSLPKSSLFPLYFITASPPQMEAKIYQKMKLDGIEPHAIFFKDNLKNFRPRKFKRLKQQVGFKVQALMELRVQIKENVKFILFGDDSESDAAVYSLFSDICQRRLSIEQINGILEALHVLPEQRKRIFKLQEMTGVFDPVEKIYINLVADTDPDYYAKFGRRVLATFTTFQAALDLYQSGHINLESCLTVGKDLISNYGFTPEEMAKNFDDLQKRGFLKTETQNNLLPEFKNAGIIPGNFTPTFRPGQMLQKIGEKILGLPEDPWVVENIDYLHDFR